MHLPSFHPNQIVSCPSSAVVGTRFLFYVSFKHPFVPTPSPISFVAVCLLAFLTLPSSRPLDLLCLIFLSSLLIPLLPFIQFPSAFFVVIYYLSTFLPFSSPPRFILFLSLPFRHLLSSKHFHDISLHYFSFLFTLFFIYFPNFPAFQFIPSLPGA